jgi:hypothetical protein
VSSTRLIQGIQLMAVKHQRRFLHLLQGAEELATAASRGCPTSRCNAALSRQPHRVLPLHGIVTLSKSKIDATRQLPHGALGRFKD